MASVNCVGDYAGTLATPGTFLSNHKHRLQDATVTEVEKRGREAQKQIAEMQGHEVYLSIGDGMSHGENSHQGNTSEENCTSAPTANKWQLNQEKK